MCLFEVLAQSHSRAALTMILALSRMLLFNLRAIGTVSGVHRKPATNAGLDQRNVLDQAREMVASCDQMRV